ncbi:MULTISPECIES: alpha-isopropylmalate synthase regulatory domain-containing protein [unclassified Imperialibacter]|uniref:alpha-isopropylmalate synthase regulatory domain-containing protein n=1 Tax=unclassified Imperialibacter TaxID=2629706 RepID=UPI0012535BDA|nr:MULTISPECIES: alpha-isopropylmalate synthase regulatory domain-containing protein [unclassified Imperialibacter]CAD5254385.1 D-citramalate synthase [Imperialibacter sp. 89]CAD5267294.1 D-citramalate synthase [Imperialibacter sp. 75]VVT00841.1 D-citramalate synthase [Imperialibacter sp. EC-SDR9]
MKVEIMDTTLRDGEQTSGVSFTDSEKLTIAQLLLEELNIDRIEVASARVSEGELKGATKILNWAGQNGFLDRVEVLGFVDKNISVDWIKNSGGKVLNLLCKGSRKHCEGQLKKTVEQHLADIAETVGYAHSQGLIINVYLEDWSNGMRTSPDYVDTMIEGLLKMPIKRIMLPDTLGILNHKESYDFCKAVTTKFPQAHFDFHAHNDYDLSTANVYAALEAGIYGVHTTLNGLGERAGNVALSSVIGIVKDHLHLDMQVDETKLYKVCKIVESFSGVRIPGNKPLIGEFVFTQTSGIHADGDSKDNLYHNSLSPDRFGRSYSYALGKMSGKANIKKNLEELGIELSKEDTKKITERIIELGDKKETITKEDLPFIINDVLRSEKIEQHVIIKNYSLSVAQGLKSMATLSIQIGGKTYEKTAAGDGQYDAFMNSLTAIYDDFGRKLPKLIDYEVQIPPGGETDALVITSITWENGKKFKTRGLDPDQTVAAIKATIKMLNIIENHK